MEELEKEKEERNRIKKLLESVVGGISDWAITPYSSRENKVKELLKEQNPKVVSFVSTLQKFEPLLENEKKDGCFLKEITPVLEELYKMRFHTEWFSYDCILGLNKNKKLYYITYDNWINILQGDEFPVVLVVSAIGEINYPHLLITTKRFYQVYCYLGIGSKIVSYKKFELSELECVSLHSNILGQKLFFISSLDMTKHIVVRMKQLNDEEQQLFDKVSEKLNWVIRSYKNKNKINLAPMICKTCGNELSYGANFCKNCGSPCSTESVVIRKKFCTNCGSQFMEGDAVCSNCGATNSSFQKS